MTGDYLLKADGYDNVLDGHYTQLLDLAKFDIVIDFPRSPPNYTPASKKWIFGHMSEFESALFGPNSVDPQLGRSFVVLMCISCRGQYKVPTRSRSRPNMRQ